VETPDGAGLVVEVNPERADGAPGLGRGEVLLDEGAEELHALRGEGDGLAQVRAQRPEGVGDERGRCARGRGSGLRLFRGSPRQSRDEHSQQSRQHV